MILEVNSEKATFVIRFVVAGGGFLSSILWTNYWDFDFAFKCIFNIYLTSEHDYIRSIIHLILIIVIYPLINNLDIRYQCKKYPWLSNEIVNEQQRQKELYKLLKKNAIAPNDHVQVTLPQFKFCVKWQECIFESIHTGTWPKKGLNRYCAKV